MQKPLSALGLSVLAGGALVVASVAPAAAQSMQGQQQMQQQAPAGAAGQAQFSDEKLESFASAATEIQAINQKSREQLSGDSGANPEDIQRQANEEIVQAVRNEGLTVEEFNQIAQEVQNDPALHARVMAMIQQKNM